MREESVKTLRGHKRSVTRFAVWETATETFLCSGSYDSTIRIWNTEGNCVRVIEGLYDSVYTLKVWNNLLYSYYGDKTKSERGTRKENVLLFLTRPS
jgi:WD40 repeat protein